MSTRLQKRKRDEEEDKAEALRETQALEKALHSPVRMHSPVQNAELREQNANLQLQVRVLQEQVGVLQEQIDTGAARLTGKALLQASLQAGLKNAKNVERIRKRFSKRGEDLTAGILSFNGHKDNPYNMLESETDVCIFCTQCWDNDGTIRIFLSSQVGASIH